jgi:prolyl oligopeptidase
MGGSNGGLLVGVAMTQRPDLYNAVVCQVPLLDMKRFNKLLAGASWMGEYGNPDIIEEWEYIKKYSPYHNLKAGVEYPEVFFYTSTRDDRVHPAHARKMNAKMNEMGYKTYYYENKEGGHAGSSTNEQRAKSNALIFSYLLKKLE